MPRDSDTIAYGRRRAHPRRWRLPRWGTSSRTMRRVAQRMRADAATQHLSSQTAPEQPDAPLPPPPEPLPPPLRATSRPCAAAARPSRQQRAGRAPRPARRASRVARPAPAITGNPVPATANGHPGRAVRPSPDWGSPGPWPAILAELRESRRPAGPDRALARRATRLVAIVYERFRWAPPYEWMLARLRAQGRR